MLYYQFYLFCVFMKKIGSNFLFVKPHVDAIFWLTAFEVLNVATIWLLFEIQYVTGNANLDVAVLAILLFILNAFSKLYKMRYKKIFNKYGRMNEKVVTVFSFLAVLYAIISIVSFYYVHSSTQKYI